MHCIGNSKGVFLFSLVTFCVLSVFAHSSLCISGFYANLSLGYIVILVDYEVVRRKEELNHSLNQFVQITDSWNETKTGCIQIYIHC